MLNLSFPLKFSFLKRILFIFLVVFSKFCFGQSPVLATGRWIKLGFVKDGIYKIDKKYLEKYRISTQGLNPDQCSAFIGSVGVLPQENDTEIANDLIEIPVFCNDTDGVFQDSDLIMFYGPSAHTTTIDSSFRFSKYF